MTAIDLDDLANLLGKKDIEMLQLKMQVKKLTEKLEEIKQQLQAEDDDYQKLSS